MILQLFTNMLRNIVGDAGVVEGGDATRNAATGTGAAPSPTHGYTPVPSAFGSPPPVFRWPYDPNARLNPRDADSPQPHEETVPDLQTYVSPQFSWAIYYCMLINFQFPHVFLRPWCVRHQRVVGARPRDPARCWRRLCIFPGGPRPSHLTIDGAAPRERTTAGKQRGD